MRFEVVPRRKMLFWTDAGVTALAVALGLIVGGVVMALAGLPPLRAYAAIFRAGFFGGAYAISDMIVKAVPLILCGVGCALAFRAGLWNVGAEGQLFLGAWAATGIASFWTPPELSAWIKIPLMIFAGGAAGAVWASVPGWLKVRFGVSEILSSLMLVYVAAQWNTFWIYSPWSDTGFQMTPMFPQTAWLPRLADFAQDHPSFAGLTAHAGFLVALIVAVMLGLLMKRSRWGFTWKAMGDNPRAAQAAGMSMRLQTILAMALSGAAAGIAGSIEVAGVVHRLQERFSPGFGFTAITVAWLARLSPSACVAVALVFGGILVGSKELGSQGISNLLQGSLLLTMLMVEFFRRFRVRVLPDPKRKEAAR
jgi:general nucleoside transport system permease protein